jgi:hypothetical protein
MMHRILPGRKKHRDISTIKPFQIRIENGWLVRKYINGVTERISKIDKATRPLGEML